MKFVIHAIFIKHACAVNRNVRRWWQLDGEPITSCKIICDWRDWKNGDLSPLIPKRKTCCVIDAFSPPPPSPLPRSPSFLYFLIPRASTTKTNCTCGELNCHIFTIRIAHNRREYRSWCCGVYAIVYLANTMAQWLNDLLLCDYTYEVWTHRPISNRIFEVAKCIACAMHSLAAYFLYGAISFVVRYAVRQIIYC